MKLFRKLKPFYIDERGEMMYILVEEKPILSILLITCKKGSVRANHIHARDSHYSYVLKGSMEYFYKEKKHGRGSIKSVIVKQNEMVYTPPKEAHAMKFLEDSVFLSFTTEKRNKDKYEKGLRRVDLIPSQL